MGSKQSKVEGIIEEISSHLTYYLMDGKHYDLKSPFRKLGIAPAGADLLYMLRVHFLLEKDTINFVHKLQDRLRRFNTSLVKQSETLDGRVMGHVNWQRTRQERMRRYPDGEYAFFCEWNYKEYNTPENLVLKKLIEVIASIIQKELAFLLRIKDDWLEEWLDASLRAIPQSVLLRNLYVKKVDTTKMNVTDRMIERVARSRCELYRDAAARYREFVSLMHPGINQRTVVELLRTTFIRPSRDPVLFELYWVVQIMLHVEKQYSKTGIEIRPQLLKRDNREKGLVANWAINQGDKRYTCTLFHNSTGGERYEFTDKLDIEYENLPEPYRTAQGNCIARGLKVQDEFKRLLPQMRDSTWHGRPDILLEIINDATNNKVLYIGEVKFTDYEPYAATGLKELLEYMAMARESETGRFIEDVDRLFDSPTVVRGWLFLDNVDLSIEPSKYIKVFKYHSGGAEYPIKIDFPD
jgi:hypothetical protein